MYEFPRRQRPTDDFYRRVHELWYGEALVGPIHTRTKLHLLTFVALLSPSEEATLRAEFSEVFSDEETVEQLTTAPDVLARLRMIEIRALKRIRRLKPESDNEV